MTCRNCGSEGVVEFCGTCGQRRPGPDDYSLGGFFRAAIGQLVNYDSRLLRTLRMLYTQPGQLARDHFDGRRGQYLEPFRIFVLFNLFAWFVVPYTAIFGFSLKAGEKYALFSSVWTTLLRLRVALSSLPAEQTLARLDALSPSKNPVAVVLMVALFAVGPTLALLGRGYRFVQHLVFAAHFYCFHMGCVLVWIGFSLRPLFGWAKASPERAASLLPLLMNLWFQHLVLWPVLAGYLFVALRRAYTLSSGEAAWRAALLGLWACTCTRAFFDVAFALVVLSP